MNVGQFRDVLFDCLEGFRLLKQLLIIYLILLSNLETESMSCHFYPRAVQKGEGRELNNKKFLKFSFLHLLIQMHKLLNVICQLKSLNKKCFAQFVFT